MTFRPRFRLAPNWKREPLSPKWWLGLIPLASLVTAPAVFKFVAVWLWINAVVVWWGAWHTSPSRQLEMDIQILAICVWAEIFWTANLWGVLQQPGKAVFATLLGVTILALFARATYWESVRRKKAGSMTSSNNEPLNPALFLDTPTGLAINFGHKWAWYYIVWMVVGLVGFGVFTNMWEPR